MTQARPNPALAAALTVLASALVACTTLLAKALGQDTLGPALPVFQISFGRFAFALSALLVASVILRPRLRPVGIPLHLLRSGLGWAGVTLMFAAAALIPLADATAISFLNPVFAMIIAVITLRETTGPWRWLAAAIALGGALILLRPSSASFQPGALVALAAALFLGAEMVCIKRLTRDNGPLQILLTNNVIGCSLAGIAAATVWIAPTPAQWVALVAIGLLMVSAQTCFTFAIARADASFVSPFWYATLVFATLYDAMIFHVLPDSTSVVGILVILAGGLTLAYRESRAARTL